MNIRRLQLLDGAHRATGLAVVIDTLRACSNIVTMFERHAERVIPVATVEEARRLKGADPEVVLAGERRGLPPPGFDLGNSPVEAESLDLTGKTVILTTSAGSKGIVAAATTADQVVIGCFLNAASVARHIQAIDPEVVSFIALGTRGELPAPEDDLAAEYMEALVRGERPDATRMFDAIREHPEGKKFSDPDNRDYHVEDLDFCLRADVVSLVPVLSEGCIVSSRTGKT